ncbi:hypothetical protein AB0M02_14785 [Actinoplanes sp. NPDC051861]|uniref:hypothetical protein n=1 Tax=Actinoplanes sp. NPDC051861 TaxID=3155170 RepID=UPI003438703F
MTEPEAPAMRHDADPISAAFPDVEVPVGGTAIDPLGPNLWSTAGEVKLTGAKVTYELSGAAGVRITPSEQGGGECENPSTVRVVCTDPRVLSFEGETIEAYLPVVVKANRTAEVGDTGTVAVTFSADGIAPISGVSEVRVIDGRESLPITGPGPGLTGAAVLSLGVLCVLVARRRAPLR